MKCKISNWGCVYHACMSDDCQKKIVQDHGLWDWGDGRCNQTLKPDSMKTFELVYSRSHDTGKLSQWILRLQPVKRILSLGPKKSEALKAAKRYCKANATKENPISLRIHKINGKYQDECTYPRSADPRKSKG